MKNQIDQKNSKSGGKSKPISQLSQSNFELDDFDNLDEVSEVSTRADFQNLFKSKSEHAVISPVDRELPPLIITREMRLRGLIAATILAGLIVGCWYLFGSY